MRRTHVAAALTVVLIVMSGCGFGPAAKKGGQDKAKEGKPGSNLSGNLTQMPWAPKELDQLERASEQLYAAAEKADWEQAQAPAQQIQAGWPTLAQELKTRGTEPAVLQAMAATVQLLQTAAAQEDGQATAAAANRLSGYLAGAAVLYRGAQVPAEVAALGYLTREIRDDAALNQWEAVRDNLTTLEVTWLDSQPRLKSVKSKQIESFDQDVAALRQAADKRDASSVMKRADKLLQTLRSMEQEFAK